MPFHYSFDVDINLIQRRGIAIQKIVTQQKMNYKNLNNLFCILIIAQRTRVSCHEIWIITVFIISSTLIKIYADFRDTVHLRRLDILGSHIPQHLEGDLMRQFDGIIHPPFNITIVVYLSGIIYYQSPKPLSIETSGSNKFCWYWGIAGPDFCVPNILIVYSFQTVVSSNVY